MNIRFVLFASLLIASSVSVVLCEQQQERVCENKECTCTNCTCADCACGQIKDQE